MGKRIIIGVSGKFASGKSTISRHLVEAHGFTVVHFAAKLKLLANDLFAMPLEEEKKDRQLLQVLGTKMREIDPDVWVKYLFRNLPGEGRFVIDDLRYRNEYAMLKTNGGIAVRLFCCRSIRHMRYHDRYGVWPSSEQERHLSETDLDEADFDLTLLTDTFTKEQVAKELDDFLKGRRLVV